MTRATEKVSKRKSNFGSSFSDEPRPIIETENSRKESAQPKFICSGGLDSTIIPVGSEADARLFVERVLAIVNKKPTTSKDEVDMFVRS